MSEFITIKLTEKKPKTNVYGVCNKKTELYLGEIKWWGAWRQYCFFPESDTLYERKCLRAIVEFIDRLMEEQKKLQKARRGQTDLSQFKIKPLKKGTSNMEWGLPGGHIIE